MKNFSFIVLCIIILLTSCQQIKLDENKIDNLIKNSEISISRADCTGVQEWEAGQGWWTYTVGDLRTCLNNLYELNNISQSYQQPCGDYGYFGWTDLGPCGTSNPTPTPTAISSTPTPTSTTVDPTPTATPTTIPVITPTPTAIMGGNPFPDRVLMPYIDISKQNEEKIQDIYYKTGQRYFILSFCLADDNGEPSWLLFDADGNQLPNDPVENGFYLDQINFIRSMGGDVAISFGGVAGSELGLHAANKSDPAVLQEKYQRVIDIYGLKWIDMNLETNAATSDRPSIDNRNIALKNLQLANPELKITFMLPVLPGGLTADGVYIIQTAFDADIDIYSVGIMTMNYGAQNYDMGQEAINAVINTKLQMLNIGFLDAQIAVCPMLGQNDVDANVFNLGDGDELYLWSLSSPYVNWLTFWSVTRDNGRCAGQIDAVYNCSGIAQAEYEFTRKMLPFTASPVNPTPPPASCSNYTSWNASSVYNGSDQVSHNGFVWEAKWWTQGDEPGTTGEWGVWKLIDQCTQ